MTTTRLQGVTLAERLLALADEDMTRFEHYDLMEWASRAQKAMAEASAALSGEVDVPREIRLWDSQWVNVVNHDSCYRDWSKDDAIAHAVRMTENLMRKNHENNSWPPHVRPGQRDAAPQPLPASPHQDTTP